MIGLLVDVILGQLVDNGDLRFHIKVALIRVETFDNLLKELFHLFSGHALKLAVLQCCLLIEILSIDRAIEVDHLIDDLQYVMFVLITRWLLRAIYPLLRFPIIGLYLLRFEPLRIGWPFRHIFESIGLFLLFPYFRIAMCGRTKRPDH